MGKRNEKVTPKGARVRHFGLRVRLGRGTSTTGPSIANAELDNCLVHGEGSVVDDLPVVTGARIERVKVFSCNLTKLWLRDCSVSDASWKGVMVIDGCVFERCVLRGELGDLNICSRALDRSVDCSSAYTRRSDWALDISNARLGSSKILGIPSRLVRRDPASQAVITRQAVLSRPDWREADLGAAEFVIVEMLNENAEDTVFIAALNSRDAKSDLDTIARLRDAGIAEPD